MHAVLPGLGYGAKLNMHCEVLKTELFIFFPFKVQTNIAETLGTVCQQFGFYVTYPNVHTCGSEILINPLQSMLVLIQKVQRAKGKAVMMI